MTEATAPVRPHASWTPNQEAACREIIDAAADLVGEQGLSACTFRAVATRAGVTKSTVHYYFDDANELMDLSVGEVFERVARFARESVLGAPGASAALEFMVRLFMAREKLPTTSKFRESMLWPAYTAHAWKRGAKESILRELETLRSVVQLALERAPMSTEDASQRATSVHNYLTGAMVRNMVDPLDRDEIARAVSALSGLDIDPAQC